jgi:hypothetical protein
MADTSLAAIDKQIQFLYACYRKWYDLGAETGISPIDGPPRDRRSARATPRHGHKPRRTQAPRRHRHRPRVGSSRMTLTPTQLALATATVFYLGAAWALWTLDTMHITR